MKSFSIHTLSALLIFIPGDLIAAEIDDRLETCLDMQDSEPSDDVIDCYNKVAMDQLSKGDEVKHHKLLLATHNRGLAYEWAPIDTPFMVYKQNYLLFYSHSSNPNYDPTTPDINPHVPIYNYPIDNRDVKFQVSFKAHLLGGGRHTLWAGYTQLSFWQFYDHKHSMPFRETNYEPELIYSYDLPDNLQPVPGINFDFINTGLVHQSDGQSLPGSRGWNRIYLKGGFESILQDDSKIQILPSAWIKLSRGTQDIEDYLGHGDLELRYRSGQSVYSVIFMLHSQQLDFALPLPKLFGVQLLDTNLHFQYFNGFGESLIDYNQNHRTYGIGISLPVE